MYISASSLNQKELKVEENSIVGVGSVVTMDVSRNLVVCESPAKFIRANKSLVFRGQS